MGYRLDTYQTAVAFPLFTVGYYQVCSDHSAAGISQTMGYRLDTYQTAVAFPLVKVGYYQVCSGHSAASISQTIGFRNNIHQITLMHVYSPQGKILLGLFKPQCSQHLTNYKVQAQYLPHCFGVSFMRGKILPGLLRP
jgi:hypothetical protein